MVRRSMVRRSMVRRSMVRRSTTRVDFSTLLPCVEVGVPPDLWRGAVSERLPDRVPALRYGAARGDGSAHGFVAGSAAALAVRVLLVRRDRRRAERVARGERLAGGARARRRRRGGR